VALGGEGVEAGEGEGDGGVEGELAAAERVEAAGGAEVDEAAAGAERVGAGVDGAVEGAEVVGELLVEARAGGEQLLLPLQLREAVPDGRGARRLLRRRGGGHGRGRRRRKA
jgi:hypothetical protein